jgi:hypothetical protein
LGYGSVLE